MPGLYMLGGAAIYAAFLIFMTRFLPIEWHLHHRGKGRSK